MLLTWLYILVAFHFKQNRNSIIIVCKPTFAHLLIPAHFHNVTIGMPICAHHHQ